MKTIRERIIERIIAQLETIAVFNGYEHNIGVGHVYRQEAILERGLAPAAVVWELSETRKRNAYGGTVRTLNVRIEGIVEVSEGKHPAVVSNELLGDIEKSLIIRDTSLDELIDDIQDTAAEIVQFPVNRRFKDLTSDILQLPIDRQLAGAAVDFEIKYTTEWGDPYAQG